MSRRGANLDELAPTYLRNRYRILFYTVLLTLVSAPILSAFKFSGILIESFLAANLLAAIMPVSGVRSRPYLLLGMVAVWLVRPFTAWLEHPTLSATQYLSGWKGAPGADAISRDAAEGLRWVRKSASQEYAPAELLLGHAVQQGISISSNPDEALRWYRRAAQHAFDNDAKNSLAWMFATSPNPRLRDGPEAVRLSKAACDATKYKADYTVDTLAAAYAESGMWEQAIEMQQRAIQVAEGESGDEPKKRAQDYSQRLALYQKQQPYRERSPQN